MPCGMKQKGWKELKTEYRLILKDQASFLRSYADGLRFLEYLANIFSYSCMDKANFSTHLCYNFEL